jgi:hypothetical protein
MDAVNEDLRSLVRNKPQSPSRMNVVLENPQISNENELERYKTLAISLVCLVNRIFVDAYLVGSRISEVEARA